MRRALVLMWVGMVLPFVLTVLNGGPDGWLPHVLFHPAYVAFLAVGLVGVRQLRSSSDSRAVRGLAAFAAAAAVLAVAGHAGEFVAVLQHGGWAAGESVFEMPLHMNSAIVTVPMVMLVIVLTAAATVAANARSVRTWLNRWARVVHRWASLAFVVALPLVLVTGGTGPSGALAVVALAVLLLTGLQMSGRHYLGRWKRARRRRSRDSGPVLGADVTSGRLAPPVLAVQETDA